MRNSKWNVSTDTNKVRRTLVSFYDVCFINVRLPTSRNTQTGKDILGGNFILGGKTGKVEEIFAQLLKNFGIFCVRFSSFFGKIRIHWIKITHCIYYQIASKSLSVLKFENFSPAAGMIYRVINYQNLLRTAPLSKFIES